MDESRCDVPQATFAEKNPGQTNCKNLQTFGGRDTTKRAGTRTANWAPALVAGLARPSAPLHMFVGAALGIESQVFAPPVRDLAAEER
jgi:hypothetical protein